MHPASGVLQERVGQRGGLLVGVEVVPRRGDRRGAVCASSSLLRVVAEPCEGATTHAQVVLLVGVRATRLSVTCVAAVIVLVSASLLQQRQQSERGGVSSQLHRLLYESLLQLRIAVPPSAANQTHQPRSCGQPNQTLGHLRNRLCAASQLVQHADGTEREADRRAACPRGRANASFSSLSSRGASPGLHAVVRAVPAAAHAVRGGRVVEGRVAVSRDDDRGEGRAFQKAGSRHSQCMSLSRSPQSTSFTTSSRRTVLHPHWTLLVPWAPRLFAPRSPSPATSISTTSCTPRCSHCPSTPRRPRSATTAPTTARCTCPPRSRRTC